MELYKQIKNDIFGLTVIYLILIIVSGLFSAAFHIGYDDTDDRVNSTRSGVSLRIDYGTGCHYLESVEGILIPRLNVDGTQVCKQ